MSSSVQSAALPKSTPLQHLADVPTVDLRNATGEREQTLKRLLDQGHVAQPPLRPPKLQFHTHLPHFLGSAYRLGADSELLQAAYNAESTQLLHIADDTVISDDDISQETWKNHINEKTFTASYVNFFDAEVKRNRGDFKGTLEQYLYSGPRPLINGMTGGLGHPFIHLAYAYELQHAGVATEALSLACTEMDPYSQIINNPPTDSSTYKTTSLFAVLRRVQADPRLDGICTEPGFSNMFVLLEHRLDVLVEHWWAWEVEDPLQQLQQVCDLSVLLALGSGDSQKGFDFFLVHLMTAAHALRVLWNEIPSERHATVLKEYALWAIAIYTSQLRRSFEIASIESVDVRGRGWSWVTETALKHQAALDAHFFKVVSAPKVFADTFGEKDDFYLKAALKFLAEYKGWVGFGQGTAGVDPTEFSKLE